MRGKSGIRGVCLPYDLTLEPEFSVKCLLRDKGESHVKGQAGRKCWKDGEQGLSCLDKTLYNN